MVKEIYVVERQSYDCFVGTKVTQKEFDNFDEATRYFENRKRYDYDYGDSYTKTIIFKAHKEVI